MTHPVADFPDHFSGVAEAYATFRPDYPSAVFDEIAAAAVRRDRCWDCATGNGQAALSLAGRFSSVVATDASAEQIAHARPHHGVEYRVEPAECTTLEPGSVNAICIAAALHWVDHDAFFAEVARVAAPGAVFAAWTYTAQVHVSPTVDEILAHYANVVLGPYWTHHYRFVQDGYRNVAIPFEPIATPDLGIEVQWTFDHLLGILGTWSAAARFREDTGDNATDRVHAELAEAWMADGPLDAPRLIDLPLAFRLARVS